MEENRNENNNNDRFLLTEALNKISESLNNYNKANRSKKLSNFGSFLFKTSLALVVVVTCLYFYVPALKSFFADTPLQPNTVSAIQFNKVIGDGNGNLNSIEFNHMLKKAYQDGKAKGVILYLNSPGGSPVESDIMYERIQHYKNKYPHIKIISVVKDICASGCYYVASATDEIYATSSSIVGSIGVIMSSFGFTDLMDKVGVERRVYTAGENKAILDPFSKVKESDEKHISNMLTNAHNIFIERVKEGRKGKIDEAKYPEVFSGLFWLGQDAKDRGLVDGFGNIYTVANDIFNTEDVNLIRSYDKPKITDFLAESDVSLNTKNIIKNIMNELSYPELK